MATSDLHAIKRALQAKFASDTLFSFLNTRLILRTGVDLTKVTRSVRDPVAAQKVLTVLKEMGYDLAFDA